MTFLDTSAILALADLRDEFHEAANASLKALSARGESFLTTSYVLGEASALLQRRLGQAAATTFLQSADGYEIEWVGPDLHRAGVEEFRRLNRRPVSLVDCVSFVLMRRRGITEAFSFDAHFSEQGFRLASLE